MNIVVLSGQLVGTPSCRERPDGPPVWSFDVATTVADPPAGASGAVSTRATVPISWCSDGGPEGWPPETDLVVAGFVRRRFFRTGGATQSRTEVVATCVVEVTKRRSLARALERAVASLGPEDRATLRSVAA